MDFDPNDGQPITGLGTVGTYLLVCKPNKLWLLVDPAGPTVRRLSTNTGCSAHRSIVASPEGTFFLSEDRGVYLTNGSSLKPISDKVLPTIKHAAVLGRVNGAYLDAHYYLSFPDGIPSGGGFTLDFDTRLNSWWKHSFVSQQLAAMHPLGGSDPPRVLFSANARAQQVDTCFAPGVWQDSGSNFAWYWQGPWQSPTFYRRRRFPTPYFRKRLRQLRLNGAGTVDLNIAFDMDSVGRTVGTDIFGGAAFDTPIWTRFNSLGVGNEWSFKLSGTSSTQDLVTGYAMIVIDRKDSQA